MKNRIKQLLKKGTELWQSSNQKYKNMKIGGMLFSIFGAICLFLSYVLMNESLIITSIAKYTFRYFALFMFCVAINFFVIYFYVYNNIKIFKSYAKYFLIPLIMLSVVTLIVGIPFTILSGVIAKILGFRAKKMDNLMSFIFYLLITIIVIGVFIYPNYILAYSISKFLENLFTIKYNLNLGVYSMGLFIFISLLKLEVDAFYRGLLFIKQRK
ncbi:hypothetical protein [Wansuia hejianensis]|uniref:Uncharacterized protein n=1 Tax=Wansuia hejianensis TaxID=2763667 RepID=A0A926EWL6_9FIRM|nr:hypothetical protein [Wansuia hejianensis]MBC8589673.1 hypothetical protein [Wansuia hejianensis]